MGWCCLQNNSRQSGAALLIVLAFVVLLTGLTVAYLSRATGHRQLAYGSYNQFKADQLAASATDNIIGDLRQEIAIGSTRRSYGSGENTCYVYIPTDSANMVPQRSGNIAAASDLVRRSVAPDNIAFPGLPSLASPVNSAPLDPAHPRPGDVTKARWNRHYLVPKSNTTDDSTDPIADFIAPDWVFVISDPDNRSGGRRVLTAPDPQVIGRYAYAIYDVGGLLDVNVAGYPSGTTIAQSGRKGSLAYADLTALGNYPIHNGEGGSAYQIDRLVGWRNYATTQPSNNFPDPSFAMNFRSSSAPAARFYDFVINNRAGFLGPRDDLVWDVYGNGRCLRTDQSFVQRQQLIAYARAGQGGSLSVNALQYLTTFSRETNAPAFSPVTPPGSTIDYAALASTPDAVNPNFLLRRVTSEFTRVDGTRAVVGEPLVKTRFPLKRLAWITYKGPSASRMLPPQTPALPPTHPDYDMWSLQWIYGIPASYLQMGTAANIKVCFGLTFPAGGAAGSPWTYSNPTGTAPASRILRLDEVASAGREPDFFELLQAGILSGSLGQSTGGGVTGQNGSGDGLVFPDVHMSNAMHHILSIGAAMIDQADPDSIPCRILFSTDGASVWTAYGVENLPYITQLYPIGFTSPDDPNKWAIYLLFQLWNPHRNVPPTYPLSVRLRVDGAIGIFKGGNGESWLRGTAPQLIANGGLTGQSVTLNSSFAFSSPAPLTDGNTINPAPAPGPSAGGAFAVLTAPPVP